MTLLKLLCPECRRKVKAFKSAQKVTKKLRNKQDATYQQKQSWKHVIARSMKLNPTPAEAKLKEILDVSKFQHRWDVSYQRQVGPYIADCCIKNRNLIIEVDGSVHADRREYDAARDRYMIDKGYKVLRLTNYEVLNNWQGSLAKIIEASR